VERMCKEFAKLGYTVKLEPIAAIAAQPAIAIFKSDLLVDHSNTRAYPSV
jgi:hypothetical protein